MATHSSIIVWEIPRTEEHGQVESMDFRRVGHDLATKQQQSGVVNPKSCGVILQGTGTAYDMHCNNEQKLSFPVCDYGKEKIL